MQKCDFRKVVNQLYWNHTSAWVFSCKLLHICRTVTLTNTYGEMLLQIFIQHACHIFQYKFVSNLRCFLAYYWLDQCSLQKEQSFIFQNFICLPFRVVPWERYFVAFCWIAFFQGGTWLNRCWNAAWTAMYLFLSKNFSTTEICSF